jgi:hypothetical protein
MNNVTPIYQAFCYRERLLTARLDPDQVKPNGPAPDDLTTSLPLSVMNTAVGNVLHNNGDWLLPVLLWVNGDDNSLLSALDFRPWQEMAANDDALWATINQHLNNLLGRNHICALVGCKESSQRFSPEVQDQAWQAGRLAAQTGFTVLTGGLSGVMTKAAKGARSVGGTTLGILPGMEKADANKYIKEVLPSGIGIARNYQIALACDVMIALNGGRGTMEEMCFALDFDKPVISWNSWELDGVQQANDEAAIRRFLLKQKEHLVFRLLDELNAESE